MKGRDLVRHAMRMQEVERIPWVPFVGVHAAELIHIPADAFLKSAEHIIAGVSKAIERYDPDGIPVVFDLQVEAEVLGCTLNWLKDNPPAVISHPLQEGTAIEDLEVPDEKDGRIPVVMQAAAELRRRYPDIALYGLITGPFTLALHLMGTDIFMRMLEEPEYVHKLIEFTTRVGKFMSAQYMEAGCDIIALVDPMTSQIDPFSFQQFVTPFARDIFSFIHAGGALSSFFVCGNAQQNIEEMCACKPDNISIDENIPLDIVRDIARKHDVSFGGNIKLTVSLLMGSEEDAQRDALQCMDIGGKQGYILAPGCDLAMSTPPENLEAITDLVRNEELQAELRASEAPVNDVEKLDLSGHWSEKQVVIDIVTLDSSSCAPCQYMVNAVAKAVEGLEENVVYREHRIKEKQGVQMMATLGVQKIPTIVMDGKVEFSSQIPPVQEIRAKIQSCLDTKKA